MYIYPENVVIQNEVYKLSFLRGARRLDSFEFNFPNTVLMVLRDTFALTASPRPENNQTHNKFLGLDLCICFYNNETLM